MASHNSATTTTLLFLITFFFLFSSPTAVFNITRILDRTLDFDTFNSYLSQTKLIVEIKHRQTITEILSVHAILDYYDIPKIWAMKRQSTLLTTLFQSTGMANDEMGFVNLTKTPFDIRLGSAKPNTGLTVDLIKIVAARLYNISMYR
ncbi:hypothetical protein Taro_016126 [Colocasia esculenta]|uniref:Uncharacterized protein n=1 Tax=Colocasia esculenta TaxID=4460 RepID=A0A843UP95_COLES|nr:hypothetical protein [Colocasia esculenta]